MSEPSGSATLSDSQLQELEVADAAVTAFIAENCTSESVTQEEATRVAVERFIHHQLHAAENPASVKFAIVTSGGTVTPLEKQEIRHITNLSTGRRGSASCEQLLRLGYRVLFLHKTGSLLPFARHFQDGSFMNHMEVHSGAAAGPEGSSSSASCMMMSTNQSQLIQAVAEYQQYFGGGGREAATQQQQQQQQDEVPSLHNPSAVLIPFHTVADYQLAMRTTLNTARETLASSYGLDMSRVLVYLVAAVADFYIPYTLLPAEKIDSKPDEDSMTIYLHKVPKALARGLVGRRWGAGSFVTTFKLETDATRIDAKVMRHINWFSNIHLVCSNLLSEVRTKVRVHDVRYPLQPLSVEWKPEDPDSIERGIIEEVSRKHAEYMSGDWVGGEAPPLC